MTMEKKHNSLPYNVPEGYFDRLEQRLSAIPLGSKDLSSWWNVRPYVALAASLAFLVISGVVLMKMTAEKSSYEDMSVLDEMRIADIVPVTNPELVYGYEAYASSGFSRSELEAYLIDTGTSLEHIEYYEDEK